jgi:alkanesulfonate monooxygenase SsuD/methylene tetrahydromethanopterin reductase-like flavin-dependent oxidoreductase (luciferase family)
MIESAELIQKLWTEDVPVTYHGQYYELQEAPFWPKPVVIYVGNRECPDGNPFVAGHSFGDQPDGASERRPDKLEDVIG